MLVLPLDFYCHNYYCINHRKIYHKSHWNFQSSSPDIIFSFTIIITFGIIINFPMCLTIFRLRITERIIDRYSTSHDPYLVLHRKSKLLIITGQRFLRLRNRTVKRRSLKSLGGLTISSLSLFFFSNLFPLFRSAADRNPIRHLTYC